MSEQMNVLKTRCPTYVSTKQMDPVTDWSLLPDDCIKLILQSYKIQLRHRMLQAELTGFFEIMNCSKYPNFFYDVLLVMVCLEDHISLMRR